MAANLATALEIATATDPGMVRSHNEDSIAADAEQTELLGVFAGHMLGRQRHQKSTPT